MRDTARRMVFVKHYSVLQRIAKSAAWSLYSPRVLEDWHQLRPCYTVLAVTGIGSRALLCIFRLFPVLFLLRLRLLCGWSHSS